MEELFTYTKNDATFDPPIVAGITWTMFVPEDGEEAPKNVASVGGSVLLETSRDNKPFDLTVKTPLYNYHFRKMMLPNGGESGAVRTFLVREIEIEDS
jgi:hypothetical protein